MTAPPTPPPPTPALPPSPPRQRSWNNSALVKVTIYPSQRSLMGGAQRVLWSNGKAVGSWSPKWFFSENKEVDEVFCLWKVSLVSLLISVLLLRACSHSAPPRKQSTPREGLTTWVITYVLRLCIGLLRTANHSSHKLPFFKSFSLGHYKRNRCSLEVETCHVSPAKGLNCCCCCWRDNSPICFYFRRK